MMKKTGDQKTSWTVPLKVELVNFFFYFIAIFEKQMDIYAIVTVQCTSYFNFKIVKNVNKSLFS